MSQTVVINGRTYLLPDPANVAAPERNAVQTQNDFNTSQGNPDLPMVNQPQPALRNGMKGVEGPPQTSFTFGGKQYQLGTGYVTPPVAPAGNGINGTAGLLGGAPYGVKAPPDHTVQHVQPTPVDPYTTAMNQGISGINAAAAAEDARINAHYDAQVGNLHQAYGSADAGVRQEGSRLYSDLNQLNQQGQVAGQQAHQQIAATNAQAYTQLQASNAGLMRDLKRQGADASGLAKVLSANNAALGANAANDANFSTRLNELQAQAMNNRMATAHVITTGSLNDLKSILNKSLADAGLQKGDALAKIAVQRIQDTATIHNEYASAIAKATAKGGTGAIPQSVINTLVNNAKSTDYSSNFKTVLDPRTTVMVDGVKTPISGPTMSGARVLESGIATGHVKPNMAPAVVEAYVTTGLGKDLSDPEKNLLRMTAGNIASAYAVRQANAAKVTASYKNIYG
jgi:hypothetical protein